MMKRGWIFGAAGTLLLLALLLQGCSSSEPEQEGQVQLVYQDWNSEWFPTMVQEILPEFHATHPNIHVFYTPDPDGLAKSMLADMQAGTAPDVFQGCCTFFPIWAQEGYTLDLRPYVEADLDERVNDPSLRGKRKCAVPIDRDRRLSGGGCRDGKHQYYGENHATTHPTTP